MIRGYVKYLLLRLNLDIIGTNQVLLFLLLVLRVWVGAREWKWKEKKNKKRNTISEKWYGNLYLYVTKRQKARRAHFIRMFFPFKPHNSMTWMCMFAIHSCGNGAIDMNSLSIWHESFLFGVFFFFFFYFLFIPNEINIYP